MPDNKHSKLTGSAGVFAPLQSQISEVSFEVRRNPEQPGPARPDAEAQEKRRSLARKILRARRLRKRHLPKSMFGEPAWDMLLVLYAADRGESQLTIKQLAHESSASATTSLRWMDFLERCKLIQRRGNPTDKRTVFMELTDLGRAAIEGYMAAAQL